MPTAELEALVQAVVVVPADHAVLVRALRELDFERTSGFAAYTDDLCSFGDPVVVGSVCLLADRVWDGRGVDGRAFGEEWLE
jgi:hypothetical protein